MYPYLEGIWMDSTGRYSSIVQTGDTVLLDTGDHMIMNGKIVEVEPNIFRIEAGNRVGNINAWWNSVLWDNGENWIKLESHPDIFPNLHGIWEVGSPNNNGRYSKIIELHCEPLYSTPNSAQPINVVPLILEDQNHNVANGYFVYDTSKIVVPEWNDLVGSLFSFGNRINWSDGTFWLRRTRQFI
ncbi:hypothetical protein [Anaerosacchariphilus polymeriproducens]|uniref:Uncharacterized protein n=1 Tax=Anaerosacchariphilus polymeriproducens TaxID=1812858 RepID=A0A371AZP2_9FIRM|nr:hypothetical protein [Anaerosacchariphilus polymeriproducens]RDU25027.1 hypothetical protein DWV06_02020 [Anaerosacchariphilus polymeriproducens]